MQQKMQYKIPNGLELANRFAANYAEYKRLAAQPYHRLSAKDQQRFLTLQRLKRAVTVR